MRGLCTEVPADDVNRTSAHERVSSELPHHARLAPVRVQRMRDPTSLAIAAASYALARNEATPLWVFGPGTVVGRTNSPKRLAEEGRFRCYPGRAKARGLRIGIGRERGIIHRAAPAKAGAAHCSEYASDAPPTASAGSARRQDERGVGGPENRSPQVTTPQKAPGGLAEKPVRSA